MRPSCALRFISLTLAMFAALAGCSHRADGRFAGYVEGEYVYISAPIDGRLQHLFVARGQQVAANVPLYELEGKDQQAERAEAEQRLASAQARVENLKGSRRSAEREISAAQVEQAKADSALADSVLARDEELYTKGLIPELRLMQSRADAKAKKSRLEELTAQARLASESIGRREEVTAASGDAEAAATVLDHADWQLAQRFGVAPTASLVQDTYYQPGEWVPATRPIVSLLPPGNIRLRFYMPETAIAGLKLGQRMLIECDGCPADARATVNYISTDPEYTPPVLFSDDNRLRLVYRIDAKPDAGALAWLKPGLPVTMHAEHAP